ncbi:uncharacterized protein LOC117172709 [Belonocnema kinseyi]|uniref:uncharacterized protein LOC117172709 n=1 Tax=Belonocnema kinseyi TaxID=2817044 RepID=UPI00143D9BE1|nr:uncharacterized protein LOC117172709 [Belonocnema kinseyi]
MDDHMGYHLHPPYANVEIDDESTYVEDADEGYDPDHAADKLIISLVREYPHVYNKEFPGFKDARKKENSWREIASIAGMDVESCQKRWTRLRERYSREKNWREKDATESGASRRKPFIFYESMNFLQQFVLRRRRMRIIKGKRKNFNSALRPSSQGLEYSKDPKWVEWNAPLTQRLLLPRTESPSDPLDISRTEATIGTRDASFGSCDVSFGSRDETRRMPAPVPARALQEPQQIPNGNTDSESRNERPCSSASFTSTTTQSSADEHRLMDPLNESIIKLTSVIKDRFSSQAWTPSPGMSPDIAFCQFVLSTMGDMTEDRKSNFKRDILKLIIQ